MELLSYAQFLKDRNNFRKAGYVHGDEFNIYDTPGHKYFKILFYFGSKSDDDNLSGFLAPKVQSVTDFYNYNTAWAYLEMNDEKERADKLLKFIELLSDINTKSPWYFNSVSGINDALDRKNDDKLEIGERKKLSIKCLPDAFDNRLTTLMELYRDVTWSWTMKREIIPANLRKFDMAIYIFETPEKNWHTGVYDEFGKEIQSLELGTNVSKIFKPSYKMIEFHDCEFNYNSITSGWSELNNSDGFTPSYTIDITYGDAFEVSYNDVIMREIGDVIETDINECLYENGILKVRTNESKPQMDDTDMIAELESRTYPYRKGFIENAVSQIAGTAKRFVEHKIERALLGNLHTYSLVTIGSQVSSAMEGNLLATIQAAKEYKDNAQQRQDMKTKQSPKGDIFPNDTPIRVKPSGNIFNKATIANNI